jgi:hypothetical protein
MLYQDDSHTTLENRYFEISLLCLFLFHHVICSCLLRKIQQTAKENLTSKIKSLEKWQVLKEEYLAANYL